MEDEIDSLLAQSRDANFSNKRLKLSGSLLRKLDYWIDCISYYYSSWEKNFIIDFCFNDNL